MSDIELIATIRRSRLLTKLWEKLTLDQRKEFLIEANGDTWHLDEVLADFVAEHREAK